MSVDMKKVSVIVPVYNTEKYLKKCLDSLVAQTLDDLEVIVVDDGSTDASTSIIKEYAMNYPDRIQAFYKKNGGQATARNLGIEMAQGKYIGFVDSDDYVHIKMYEILYELAEKTSADMAVCNYRYVSTENESEIELTPYVPYKKCKTQADQFIDPLVAPWNKLFLSEVIQTTKINFLEGYIYEDTAFFIKLIPYLKQVSYVEDALVTHVFHGSSTMNANRGKRVGDIFPVLNSILSYYKELGFYSEYKNEIEYFCIKLLLCSSLARIALVRDRKLRNNFLYQTNLMIQKNFRQYRKNPYFKGGLKNKYIKSVNRFTLNFYCFLLYVMQKFKKSGS